ncbi:MAG: tetratricopeptide repeat protein, partial [Caldilineaceae bacterium]|nr:tetratricopeptide repeat protein [Caldilineaceae bacterium]
RSAGDRWSLAMSLSNMGDLLSRLGRFEEADAVLEEGVALHRQVGQQWGLAHVLGKLARHHLRCGRIDAADAVLAELHPYCGPDAAPDRIAYAAYLGSLLALQRGEPALARQQAATCLHIFQREGTRDTQLVGVALAAKLALALDRPDAALTLLAALDAVHAHWGMVPPPLEADELAQTRAAALAAMDDAAAGDHAWATGAQ